MNLTLNTYTQWYWKTDLHNLFGFLRLRGDAHAQYEIRVYAEAMLKTVEAWVPQSCAALSRLPARRRHFLGPHVGRAEKAAGRRGRRPAGQRLSRREWEEFREALGQTREQLTPIPDKI